METDAPTPAVRLSGAGRAWRSAVAISLCAVLLWGTLAGQDDHFPVGPFRMFSTRQRLDGSVTWYEIRVVRGSSSTRLEGPEIGLRRAEIEGQRTHLVAEPALLCLIVAGEHAADPVDEVVLVRVSTPLSEGRPAADRTEEVAARCVP